MLFSSTIKSEGSTHVLIIVYSAEYGSSILTGLWYPYAFMSPSNLILEKFSVSFIKLKLSKSSNPIPISTCLVARSKLERVVRPPIVATSG